MNQKNQKTHVPLLILLFLIGSWAKAQDKVTISGTIVNSQNNETLIGVSIYIPELQSGTTTNEYGFFSLSIPKGDYTLQVSYMGFQTSEEKISLQQNLRKNISLESSTQNLEEIVITERKNIANIKKPEMSVNKLTIQEIKKMPAVMGETDILKSILQLPGVTNAGEGASGFNVRGGAADQNLILLDEALLYNSSHLFGFFSVFNSDAIKDLKLYKGGIPSRFGGRVSSVLDIYQKEGNSNEFHMNGGIGVISSRLLAEGPLEKGKGSFLVAGRSSYAHLFLKLTDNKNSAYFYDLNTKLSYKLNENNSLFLSGYFGRDVFDIGDQFNNVYGNAVLNLRWNHLYSEKLFSNLSMIYSDYYYGLKLDVAGLNWDSGIKNYNIKYDFKHYISDRYKMTYGLNAVYYDFNPGTVSPTGASSGINREQLDKKYALEPALYVDAEHEITDKLSINYGFRYSMFYRMGQQDMNIYANNEAVTFNPELQIYEKGKPIGTEHFGSGKTIASFDNLEPRLAVSYQLDDNQSIKASYNRMSQYIHLVSNTASPTPLDVWAPSDNFIKPQLLDQVALGYFRNFHNDDYTLETEIYYKKSKTESTILMAQTLLPTRQSNR